MEHMDEAAVSPVVGVMLMLVVVIIIAAVVSAFAGGFVQTSDKAPQASITGKYSQSTGLEIVHSGGDALVTKDISIILRPTADFGQDLNMFNAITVNSSYIQDNTGVYWLNAVDGTMGVITFRPGESMYVTCTDVNKAGIATCPPYYSTTNKMVNNYWVYTLTDFGNSINVGKSLELEVYDIKGRSISKSKIMITS